ncbi:hypothetical protein CLF_102792 [Clonorchis sinensis]|uniref:Uncharacterized protein n=1 Tax=Clonorchis sinensis TaxID=79923 RepID=G7Y8I8_CLOSI|nr:hypothetical protein CLF_102792 [Clonorchis sinensis]
MGQILDHDRLLGSDFRPTGACLDAGLASSSMFWTITCETGFLAVAAPRCERSHIRQQQRYGYIVHVRENKETLEIMQGLENVKGKIRTVNSDNIEHNCATFRENSDGMPYLIFRTDPLNFNQKGDAAMCAK